MIERFVPEGGGVENVAWQVAHGLARVGEDVTVVSREIHEPATETARPTVETVFAPRLWQPLRVLTFSQSAGRRVRRGDRPRFDVVHSFSRTRHQDLYRAGGGSHADYLERTHPGIAGRLRGFSPRHRALLSIEGRVFRDVRQRVQCASRLVARRLSERHDVDPERILLLPNGIDLERYASDSARAAGRALRGRETEGRAPVWLFPGSGWRRKGLDRVFQALARSMPTAPHVWVAGRDAPGPWRRRAARLGIADRIRFLGPRRDLEVLYHAVDGMLLPTRYDPFANVTLEAAAAGLAIVTTRANGAAEWLGEACRVLDEDDDPSQLARTLAGLGEPTARAAIGARAARRAQDFGWPAHIEALREEYRRIVEAQRATREVR